MMACAMRRMIAESHQTLFDAVNGTDSVLLYNKLGMWIAAESHFTSAKFVDGLDQAGTVGIQIIKAHVEFDTVVWVLNSKLTTSPYKLSFKGRQETTACVAN